MQTFLRVLFGTMPAISKESLFVRKWYTLGIKYVTDVVDENGNFLSLDVLKNNCNDQTLHTFDYIRVKTLVTKFVNENNKGEWIQLTRPFIPFHTQILYKSSKGSQDFYKILNVVSNLELKIKKKWSDDIGILLSNDDIKSFFVNCFQTIDDNYFKYFQYRIISRILGTNQSLYKFKISDTPLCRLCNQYPETLIHLFVTCNEDYGCDCEDLSGRGKDLRGGCSELRVSIVSLLHYREPG